VSDTWLLIPGGQCRYGDNARPVEVAPLLWTATPLTPRHLGESGPCVPVTQVSHEQAESIARALGGRLPRSAEWEWMAAGADRRRYPWGEAEWDPSLANLLPAGADGPVAAGRFPAGATPEGMLDVAGNVWEWTATKAMGNGYVIRGGSYASQPAYARTTFLNTAPAALRSPGLGFRVVRDP
jgi:formylglycine-generating enzyme